MTPIADAFRAAFDMAALKAQEQIAKAWDEGFLAARQWHIMNDDPDTYGPLIRQPENPYR